MTMAELFWVGSKVPSSLWVWVQRVGISRKRGRRRFRADMIIDGKKVCEYLPGTIRTMVEALNEADKRFQERRQK